MKVQYQKEPSLKEDYVEVHFREESEKIKTIRDFFTAFESITGKKENDIHKLHPESIYYLECFENSGFVRIGKVCKVFTLLLFGKILLELIVQKVFGNYQENILLMFGLSLLATFVLSFPEISSADCYSGTVYIADWRCYADNMDRRMFW